MAESGPALIARAIQARRIELGLSVEDAAFDARIHVTAWRLLEQGVTQPSALTLRSITRVLGWTPATIESLLHGELRVDGDGDVVVDLDRWPDRGTDHDGEDASAHEPVAPAPPPDVVPVLDVTGLTADQLADVQTFIDFLRSDEPRDDR